jgi:hypothetical protein
MILIVPDDVGLAANSAVPPFIQKLLAFSVLRPDFACLGRRSAFALETCMKKLMTSVAALCLL